jgi:hypothetical protein
MAKKKVEKLAANTPIAAPTPQQAQVVFPELSPKSDLECVTFLEDQILLIDVRPLNFPLSKKCLLRRVMLLGPAHTRRVQIVRQVHR